MRIARALLPLLLLSTSWQAHAKPTVVPPAVLARVRAAHHIFVSNAGEDDYISYDSGNGEGAPYLLLYQQLVGWPGVQLVDSPAQADLIFQVYGDSSQGLFDKSATVYLHLTILDPATQQVLWTYTSESFSAKAVLKPIAPTNPAPHPGKEFARLPAQLKNPQKLFIQLSPLPQPPGVPEAGEAFSQAIVKSGNYTLVDTPDQADLILSVAIDESTARRYKNSPPILGSIRVSILDPKTKTILWTFNNEFVYSLKITIEQQIPKTMPYVVQTWNSLIGKSSFACHIQIVGHSCSME
jgi:hypothetical protein